MAKKSNQTNRLNKASAKVGGFLLSKNKGKTVAGSDGKRGGYFNGKRHSEGGIQCVNKTTGEPLEVETDEVIITRNAVLDGTKREFEGELLTNRQILSRINERAGGVAFADGGEVKPAFAEGGSVEAGLWYHGSKNKALEFGAPKEGKERKSNMQLDFGTHFTNQEYAAFYAGDKGVIYAAKLELKHPLDLTKAVWYRTEEGFDQVLSLIKALKLEKFRGAIDYTNIKTMEKEAEIQSVCVTAHSLDSKPPKKVFDALKACGFDSIIYEPYHPSGLKHYEKKPKSVIVLDKNQIKVVSKDNKFEEGGPLSVAVTGKRYKLDGEAISDFNIAHRCGCEANFGPTQRRTIRVDDIEFENREGQRLLDALKNVQEGNGSKTEGPIKVYQARNGRYEIADGFHRAADALNNNRETIEAYVHTERFADGGAIADTDGVDFVEYYDSDYTRLNTIVTFKSRSYGERWLKKLGIEHLYMLVEEPREDFNLEYDDWRDTGATVNSEDVYILVAQRHYEDDDERADDAPAYLTKRFFMNALKQDSPQAVMFGGGDDEEGISLEEGERGINKEMKRFEAAQKALLETFKMKTPHGVFDISPSLSIHSGYFIPQLIREEAAALPMPAGTIQRNAYRQVPLEAMKKLAKGVVSKDNLRPDMNHLYGFRGGFMLATNPHVILSVPVQNMKIGMYTAEGENCNYKPKKEWMVELEEESGLFAVIPYHEHSVRVDLVSLYRYLSFMLLFVPKKEAYKGVRLSFTDAGGATEYITFDMELLQTVIGKFLMMGVYSAYFSIGGHNSGVVISERKPEPKKSKMHYNEYFYNVAQMGPFAVVMPVYDLLYNERLDDGPITEAYGNVDESISVHLMYDLTHNEVVNAHKQTDRYIFDEGPSVLEKKDFNLSLKMQFPKDKQLSLKTINAVDLLYQNYQEEFSKAGFRSDRERRVWAGVMWLKILRNKLAK